MTRPADLATSTAARMAKARRWMDRGEECHVVAAATRDRHCRDVLMRLALMWASMAAQQLERAQDELMERRQ